ncbi:MAG: hypothetical protein ACREMG_07195 [Gemmatimonadales bacterium]
MNHPPTGQPYREQSDLTIRLKCSDRLTATLRPERLQMDLAGRATPGRPTIRDWSRLR